MNNTPFSFDITFPVYNEELQLQTSVLKTMEFCKANCIPNYIITIADNGSTDNTANIARRLNNTDQRVRYVRVEQKGVGIALKTAWSSSPCDIVGFMDIDLSTDLSHLNKMYSLFLSRDVDLVVGSRLKEGAVVNDRTLLRELTSRAFNKILKIILSVGFTDGMCGFKFLHKHVFEHLMRAGILNDEWFFETELLIKAEWNGFIIKELPVYWTDDHDSKVVLVPTTLSYLKEILRLKKELRAQKR